MDLKLSWVEGQLDLTIENGQLATDRGLVTMVLISLFSDGRAKPDQVLAPDQQDLRGWWAEDPADPYGSLLWTLRRSKHVQETANQVRDYVLHALGHFLRQQIASSLEVECRWQRDDVLEISIAMARGNARRWQYLWDGLRAETLQVGGVLLKLDFA